MEKITTAEQFNEIINNPEQSLIKFDASWCPDCRRMDMFIGPIEEKYNRFTWYEVDRDALPEIADKHEVMGIPSLLVFKDGEKRAHLHSANAKTPDQVTTFLDSYNA